MENVKSRMVIIPPLGIKIEDTMNFNVFEEKVRRKGTPDEYTEDQIIGYHGSIASCLLSLKNHAFKLVKIEDHQVALDSIDKVLERMEIVEAKILEAAAELKIALNKSY